MDDKEFKRLVNIAITKALIALCTVWLAMCGTLWVILHYNLINFTGGHQ